MEGSSRFCEKYPNITQVLYQKKPRHLVQGMLDPLIDPGIKTRRKSDKRGRSIFVKEREERKKIAFWEKKNEENEKEGFNKE